MRMHSKMALLAGVAASALTFGSSAFAFDNVDWNWNQNVNTNVTVNAGVTTNIDPSGLTDLEKLQLQIGDVSATSTVDGVYNNQPTLGGDGTIDFTVSWAGTQNDGPNPSVFGTGVLGGPQASLGGDLSGSGDLQGTLDEGSDAMQLSAVFTDVPVTVAGSDTFNALTELPQVASAATAVGNNQSITSDVGTQIHDTQVLFGGFNDEANGGILPDTGNTGLSAALAVAVNGAYGVITPADITANSSVSNILNASVDSNATAVGNNANIEVDAATPSDAMLIGDFSQVAYANVSATSNVSNVNINNYPNLGSLDHPIVNSAATAVGNNMNIKVTAPAPVTGP
ncbi:MAG: hypothetical protein ACTHLR_00190 [Rhizomicrobium sp.]